MQELLDLHQSDDLLKKEEELLKDFDVVLEQEEVVWMQKSREKWFVHGDRNTKFFHTSTIIRRRRNQIEMLQDNDGRWLSNAQELETHAIDYYKRLYSLDDLDAVVEQLPQEGFTALSEADFSSLTKPFSPLEVEGAIRSMGKYKAPGPDGFQPVFYQQGWEVVGESVTKFVMDFFSSGSFPQETNDVLVVLIAKVLKPEKITQFRPISLCNVLFKTITKVMVGRLKGVINKLIGPAQTSFIPGRLSTDNIVVVQEVVHSMRRKKGVKGWMLLKLDLEKAYDRIRWDLLEDTLKAAGLPGTWVQWIMKCVEGPSMRLLWNGEKTDAFKPLRGLRQGDPLSPYLFVLCIERLCHLIESSIAAKKWKPIKISQSGPRLSHICFADDLILFAEASIDQIRVLRGVLEKFCGASGQKVSLEKSKIYFSKNVLRDLGKRISEESGMKATKDLGKYLGVPILQKRINKETFGEVIKRFSSRLAGWKGRMLSFAGRLTLTKAVLTSILVHTMSTIKLPQSTLDGLDKVSRAFLWGSTLEKKKQHLVAWTRVCLPRREGGLGIRSATAMNKALIAKVGWRVLNDGSSLWAQVVRSKYKVGDVHDRNWTVAKSNWSSTWRSVGVGLRDVIWREQHWVIGDGRQIRFWTDRWLSETPIADDSIVPLSLAQMLCTARDLWRDGTGWDMSQIAPFVTDNKRLDLLAVIVDSVTGAHDRLAWGMTSDGRFTVKSAFAMLTNDDSPRQDMSSLYGRVWKVQAPERVRVFLWLVVNQAIMTNSERKRRHLCDSDVCQVCRGGIESILHVLRDCPAMSGIWDRIVPRRLQQSFFTMSLLEWLYSNLRQGLMTEGSDWSTMFAMAVWWGWKWRCSNIFGENKTCRDRVRFIKDLAVEVSIAYSREVELRLSGLRVNKPIRWTPPMEGWYKINTDGASRGNPGLASAGGVLRNSAGAWCGGFAVNIGRCSAPLAELWGVYYGLYMAWAKQLTHLELEVDSEVVVGFLKTGIGETHPLSFLVRLCHNFLSKDWTVRISHVYREANSLADGLANHAFSLSLGLHVFDEIPISLVMLLSEDNDGPARLRRVCL